MGAAKKQDSLNLLLEPRWTDQVELVSLEQVSSETTGDIGIGDDLGPVDVINFVLSNGLKHICQRSNPFFNQEVQTAALISTDAAQFATWPVSSILKPLSASAKVERDLTKHQHKFQNVSDKNYVLSEIEHELMKVTRSGTLISEVCCIVDEIFTNAVFNAPYSDFSKRAKAFREKNNQSPGGLKDARISFGYDDQRIAVVCQDYYGSLEVTQLLERVRECYISGVASNINMGSGGAGIGSYMVFNTCLSYYVTVEPGKKTTVACSLPLLMSARKRAALPKNLHCVVY